MTNLTLITVKCVAEDVKSSIVTLYQNKKHTIKEIAKIHSTSTRTVGRVLEERGIALPRAWVRGEAHVVMKLLAERNVTPADLTAILNIFRSAGINSVARLGEALSAPALTEQNIQSYLNQCSKEKLASHFYTSGLIKIAEIAKHAADLKQQNTSLFQPQRQQPALFREAVPG